MSGQVIAAESNRVLALIVLLSVLALVVLLWARLRRNRPSGPEYAPGLATATASTVDELLGSFLDWLHRTAPADPFDPQVVLVPNAGMAEYLEAAVRADARFGVCTNVEFVFPGRLRQRSGVVAIWPFSVDETMWLVLRALEDEELAAASGLHDRLAERPLAVARHIAELFERYHSYRPQMLAAWRDGEYLDDRDGQALDPWFRWQCDLFRAIDAIAPTPDVAPRDLPNRIALFGLGAPVGALAEVVHALEVDTEIAAFLLVPGALPPALERWRAPAIAALEHFDEGATTPGPCRLPVGELHLSYGAPREFDAVRDALLERLDADPTLTARDVTVIAPAIQQFAPIAVPVLSTPLVGHSEQAPRRLPVRVTDRVPALSPSVGSALDALLVLATSRCGPSDVLELLSFEPVANRFGLDPDAVTLVTEWAIDGLDVRWGLDGDHRTRWGYDAGIDVGAWAPAVDRLLIGMLVQDPTGVGASLTSDRSRPIVH
ncbi:MAG: exodeoxyribonuclease V subunit gamma [Actinomycetes bacterium]